MRDQSESSFDLERAVNLSRRLSSRQPIQATRPEVETPTDYANFLSDHAPVQRSVRKGSALVREILPSPRQEPRNWDELVLWCASSVRCDSGFVVDGKGFVIAHYGRDEGRFEGMGAELAAAMDQLAMAHVGKVRLTWVEVAQERHRTLCIPIAGEAGWDALVVLLTAAPVAADLMEALTEKIQTYSRSFKIV